MKIRAIFSVILIVCFSFILANAGLTDSQISEQKNTNHKKQSASDKIYGKVTDTIDVSGYTYAEIDTGEEKIWAAGPITPLKTGDQIAITTGMPMENFYSTSLERDFSILYFVGRFITNEETPTTETESITSPHNQLKQKQVATPVKGINKVEGGNTIAEIIAQKNNLNGNTLRVRGQVTKFTAQVMGKNWIHIMDSSTLDDLTATSDSTVAIGDIVIIEGKLELDKDFSYGYVYPVILEDARIIRD